MTGAATCLWQALPSMTNFQIMEFIRESSSQYDMPDYLMGHGIPNFQLALDIGLIVQAQQQTEFLGFPNPVSDELQIIFPGEIDKADLFIFDVLGKLVLNTTILSNDRRLNLENLSSGIYLARFQASNNTSQTFKLIKK